MLDAIGGMGDEATAIEVARAFAKDRGNTYKLLQDMVADGQLVRKGDTYSLPQIFP